MESINLEFPENIYQPIKIVLALFGFIALIARFRESFSLTNRKQTLKLDLEILDLAIKNNSPKNEIIKNRVEEETAFLYEFEQQKGTQLTNFITGIALFVGFAMWTVDLFHKSEGFNGWAILTMFLSGIGISLIFDTKSGKNFKGEFFRIEFYDKTNFVYGFIFFVMVFIISLVLFNTGIRNFWFYLTSFLSILFLFATTRNIKFRKIRKKINVD